MEKQKHTQRRTTSKTKIVNKIIIRLPNFIGDSIMSTSAIQLLLLEYPTAKITIVCRPLSEDIFCNHPAVKKIIIDESKSKKNRIKYTLSLIKKIRKEEYDLGILFNNNFLSALIFKFSRIKTIIGYENEFRSILLNFHLKIDRTQHYINRYAQLINKYLLNKYTKLPQTKIWCKLTDKLTDFNNDKPIIVLNLGNNSQKYRAYPFELSLNLIERLISSNQFNLILVGDKHDAIRADQYNIKFNTNNVINLTNKTTISNYINIINQSNLLVTIDSSAMHIAAAVGTPFITLLGKSTSAFSTVKPKVGFGIYLKNEDDLINEELFISQISPKMILTEIQRTFSKEIKSSKFVD